jgi:hypothetical protein
MNVYGGIVKFAMSLTRAVVERRLDRDADNAVKDPRAPVDLYPGSAVTLLLALKERGRPNCTPGA